MRTAPTAHGSIPSRTSQTTLARSLVRQRGERGLGHLRREERLEAIPFAPGALERIEETGKDLGVSREITCPAKVPNWAPLVASTRRLCSITTTSGPPTEPRQRHGDTKGPLTPTTSRT